MKKIAFFVEGETEAFFVEKYLKEVVSQRNITFKTAKFSGGKNNSLRIVNLVNQVKSTSAEKYIVNIYISGCDNRVNSDIRDNITSLKNVGFQQIIGLKDLRGVINGRNTTINDLPLFEQANKLMFNGYIPQVNVIIAVMEIETWFIGETNHYEQISPSLTYTLIVNSQCFIKINPYISDLTTITHPAETLNDIYSLVGAKYNKSKSERERTINALDFSNFYFNLPSRIRQVKNFVDLVDSFLG